jgi:hypothetical protein
LRHDEPDDRYVKGLLLVTVLGVESKPEKEGARVRAYALEADQDPFDGVRKLFVKAVDWLSGNESAGLAHGDLETQLAVRFRDLARQAVQDHLDLRAQREELLAEVVDAAGVTRGRVEVGRERGLATIFGEVVVDRIAYRERGYSDLHPADAVLNLPTEKHSHGLRKLAALEAAGRSFGQAVASIGQATGARMGKRQVEALTVRAAVDVDGFYAQRRPAATPDATVLAMSADAKGVVMRPESLRATTAKAQTSQKLATRLSAGEKRNRKRMAEVVSVFDCVPAVRTPDDILPAPDQDRRTGPVTRGKWLAASVAHEAAEVITTMFDEATRRDPEHRRTWICLLDGNAHQIDRVSTEAEARDVPVTIIIDFIHVLEHLWTAAWCLHPTGDPAAETWVRHQARQILSGQVDQIITELATQATDVVDDRRTGIDRAIKYLTNQQPYLDYPTALASGWPIATGVIEGACRHLVKDRLDITGARWGLDSAEAVLKLRALISNGDFDDYWTYHIDKEHQRVHKAHYADSIIPEP